MRARAAARCRPSRRVELEREAAVRVRHRELLDGQHGERRRQAPRLRAPSRRARHQRAPLPPFQAVNEVVVWDRVVGSREESQVQTTNAFIKYPVIHHGHELRGVPLSLSLHWDVMPLTGVPYLDRSAKATAVTFPAEYCADAECRLKR